MKFSARVYRVGLMPPFEVCLLKNGSLGPLRSGGLIALALVTENVVERQLSDLGVKLFGPPDLIVKYPG